jgi:hypothetical protein
MCQLAPSFEGQPKGKPKGKYGYSNPRTILQVPPSRSTEGEDQDAEDGDIEMELDEQELVGVDLGSFRESIPEERTVHHPTRSTAQDPQGFPQLLHWSLDQIEFRTGHSSWSLERPAQTLEG